MGLLWSHSVHSVQFHPTRSILSTLALFSPFSPIHYTLVPFGLFCPFLVLFTLLWYFLVHFSQLSPIWFTLVQTVHLIQFGLFGPLSPPQSILVHFCPFGAFCPFFVHLHYGKEQVKFESTYFKSKFIEKMKCSLSQLVRRIKGKVIKSTMFFKLIKVFPKNFHT